VSHVLNTVEPLPQDQTFYDHQAAQQTAGSRPS